VAHYEIGYHRWTLPGLIPKPGRLHSFSDVNREVAILLDKSGIGLKKKQLIVCPSSSSVLRLTSVHDAKAPRRHRNNAAHSVCYEPVSWCSRNGGY
jgi:hypothetical protein